MCLDYYEVIKYIIDYLLKDDVALKDVVSFEKDLQDFVSSSYAELLKTVNKEAKYDKEVEAQFLEVLQSFKKTQS